MAATTPPNTVNQPPIISAGNTKSFASRTALAAEFICALIA